jgi:photosystem II stability/assembly factor-like uncharacterized protein
MKLPLLTMLLLCHAAFAQWSPVKTFDATSHIQSITDFDFLNEQKGFLISYNNNKSTFYRTTNGGMTWDSTTTVAGFFRSMVMVTDSIIYAAGNVDINLGTPNAYQSKQIYRSLNAGQTWTQHEIFNTLGLLDRNCMVFTNDSTGFVSCYAGMYQTNDYGTSWTLLNTNSGQFPVHLGSEIATFYNNDVYLTNTSSLASQTNTLDCYGIGGVGFTSSYGDTLIRTNNCNDGWGNTLRALTISELGGSTTVLHFLDEGISDVALNASGIFAVSQRPLRSMDGGQSFFRQGCTLPSDSLLFFTRIEFIDNDIAYALAINQDSGIIKLLKTTNAGGITTNYVTQPLQNVGGLHDNASSSIHISPNPSSNGIFNVSGIQTVDATLLVFNELGQIVHQAALVGNGKQSIDLSNQAPGVYFAHISQGDLQWVRKLVVR